MFVIRPVRPNDLDALERFANSLSLGMLSLPKDRAFLQKKIVRSMEALSKNILLPKEELYLFVLEDTSTGAARGCCGVYAKTGIDHPLFYYRLETVENKKSVLPLPSEMKILHPTRAANGPSELCALFIEKDLRKEKLGELLSLSRFLFISEHPNRFDNKILARLRGFINKTKQTSPFWDGLGKHFLQMEFIEAQDLHSRGTEFIAEFLPKYPIYTALLPKQAQYVIQKTHVTTRPAMKMLQKEGFVLNDQIDVLEAGPVVEAKTESIRSVKESILATVTKTTSDPINSRIYIISNPSLDFRACYGNLTFLKERSVLITKDTAAALNIKEGDPIRFVTTH
jgi:arginine N-succinyltransferase